MVLWMVRFMLKGLKEGSTLGKKENSMVSPMLAWMSFGLNEREPLPTATEMVAACASAAEAAVRSVFEKCMSRLGI